MAAPIVQVEIITKKRDKSAKKNNNYFRSPFEYGREGPDYPSFPRGHESECHFQAALHFAWMCVQNNHQVGHFLSIKIWDLWFY
jgi:hypothetical protein